MRLDIDEKYLRAILKRLLAIPSPSGFTDDVAAACAAELRRLGLSIDITRRGAVRARLPGLIEQPARALVAHVDTLGAQVKMLKENGRLQIVPIGHWSARFAEGARCTIFSETRAFRGTILPLKASGHTYNTEIDTQPVGWEHVELRIDEHVLDKVDVEQLGIGVGDIVSIDPLPEFMDNGFIISRHLDDKAGVAILFAALEALLREGVTPPVDTYFILTIAEEVGQGASSVLMPHVASMITIDNGATAPGQNSSEFGVTIAMADQTGPFDLALTRKLVRLCRDNSIGFQKDVFRYYRSDSASALDAGADIRTALVTFGVDASHGYERIHVDALRSVAELLTAYVSSEVEIKADAEDITSLAGRQT